MTPVLFAVVALAGGVGAGLRFLLDGLIRSRTTASFPVGTAVINLTGSFVLGFLTSLAIGQVIPQELAAVLGVGLLGGYTTFSTASYETVQLVRARRYRASFVNGVGVLCGAVASSALGLWLGWLL